MVTNSKSAKHFDRITILAIVVFILTAFLILCLFKIQILDGENYTVQASKQRKAYQDTLPKRGSIFIYREDYDFNNNLYPIATNEYLHEISAVPKDIKNPEKLSQQIADILNLDKENLFAKFSKKNDSYEPILNYATDSQVEKIQALDCQGIKFSSQENRVYPEANIYSHITGFLGYGQDKRIGQYGLEGGMEKILAGQAGEIISEKDIAGDWIPTSKKVVTKAIDGSDLILTVDNSIQHFVCNALQQGVEKYGASSGSVAVINPKTGAILAMCGYPNFDPNDYSHVENIDVYKNQVVTEAYEPGSIFKAITMASALDAKAITPETTYEDTGEVKIGVEILRNSDLKAHGVCDMIEVLDKSLNTGAIFVMRQIGPAVFKDYVKKFGFGESTGIELGPEAVGNISNLLNKSGEIYSATASYGQGIAVTPIQMIASFTPIANNGFLVKPYIIAKIINPNGEIIETQPQRVRQVISSQAVASIKAMLVSVIKSGHAKKAGVSGYYVAGKTGTADVPKKGGYFKNKTIHSFIGFAPVDNPAFIALVKLDHPSAVRFAADSAAPIFGQIAKFILDYYQVPPSY